MCYQAGSQIARQISRERCPSHTGEKLIFTSKLDREEQDSIKLILQIPFAKCLAKVCVQSVAETKTPEASGFFWR